eukprot:767178-Hanusia_phi.AAC.4
MRCLTRTRFAQRRACDKRCGCTLPGASDTQDNDTDDDDFNNARASSGGRPAAGIDNNRHVRFFVSLPSSRPPRIPHRSLPASPSSHPPYPVESQFSEFHLPDRRVGMSRGCGREEEMESSDDPDEAWEGC